MKNKIKYHLGTVEMLMFQNSTLQYEIIKLQLELSEMKIKYGTALEKVKKLEKTLDSIYGIPQARNILNA